MSDYERVEVLLEAGRSADALRLLAPALAADPENSELWSYSARAHLGAERWAEGLESARRLIALEPDDGLGHCVMSKCFSGLNRTGDALDSALRAVYHAPHVPYFHMAVAQAASVVPGRADLAWQAAHRAVEMAPHSSETHTAMGFVAMHLGRRALAKQAFEHALLLDPGNHVAQHNLGLVQVQSGRFGAAVRELQSSSSADPGSALSEQAFHILVLTCLRRLHVGLAVIWVVFRVLTLVDSIPDDVVSASLGSGPSGILLGIWGVGMLAIAVWLVLSMRGADANLLRLLWNVMRDSPPASGWIICLAVGAVFLLATGLAPSYGFRSFGIFVSGFALAIGGWMGWMEVGLSRRKQRS